MSALPVPSPQPSEPGPAAPALSRSGRRLRPLAASPRRMARLPFLAVLLAVFGVGMAGLLMLNTTLQNQAFAARTLNRQATELTYVEADLNARLDAVAAPASLAQQASSLGLRANPYPALLVLPSGKVIGHPRAVRGNELPALVVRSPEQQAGAALAAGARQAVRAQQQAQSRLESAQARAAEWPGQARSALAQAGTGVTAPTPASRPGATATAKKTTGTRGAHR